MPAHTVLFVVKYKGK